MVNITGMAITCALGSDGEIIDRLLKGETAVRLTVEPSTSITYPCAPLTRPISAVETLRGHIELALQRAGIASEKLRNWALILATSELGSEEFEPGLVGQTLTKANPYRNWSLRDMADKVMAPWPNKPTLFITTAACSASVHGLALGDALIQSGCYQLAVVATIQLIVPHLVIGFRNIAAFASTSCRPFAPNRDGVAFGEGVGAMVLEPVESSEPTTGRLYAVALKNDSFSLLSPNPSGETVTSIIREVLRKSDVPARDIGFIKAHGTGTVKGDAAEARAISEAFGSERYPVTSYKGAVGHTLEASGLVESGISLMALKRGIVPPVSGNYVPDQTLPIWVASSPVGIYKGKKSLGVSQAFGGPAAVWILGVE